MQFILIAHNGTDPEAPARRQKARPTHLAHMKQAAAEGHVVAAGALRTEEGEATGSFMVLEFSDRAGLDDFLAHEPYAAGDVWKEISITHCTAVFVDNRMVE